MTVYAFTRVLVWDQIGGSVKIARNQRVNVLDPASCAPSTPTVGTVAPGLTQGGVGVGWLTSGSDGHADFTSTLATVRVVSPNGFWEDVTSPTAVLATATDVATDVATSIATEIAVQIARGDSHVLLDTDGTPYFDTADPGTEVILLDTDGIPYLI